MHSTNSSEVCGVLSRPSATQQYINAKYYRIIFIIYLLVKGKIYTLLLYIILPIFFQYSSKQKPRHTFGFLVVVEFVVDQFQFLLHDEHILLRDTFNTSLLKIFNFLFDDFQNFFVQFVVIENFLKKRLFTMKMTIFYLVPKI